MTLSDTHLVLLSAAAQHPQQLLLRPQRLADKTVAKLADKLMLAGLAEEVRVKLNQPRWSVNEAGDSIGLRITAAGLTALGLGDDSEGPPVEVPSVEEQAPAEPEAIVDSARAVEQIDAPALVHPAAPRPGSKKALMVSLLGQQGGTSVEDLMTATGWLPHTVRAALTGLRQTGYSLAKERDEAGVTHYRLSEPAADAETSDADRAA